MAKFTATARIPCRPLSYEYKELALEEELMVDYKTGNIYINRSDGTIVDISSTVKEIVIEHIKDDPTVAENIKVTIDGKEYSLETIVADQATNIDQLKNALGYYVDETTGEVKFDLLDKIATIDPDTGDITFTIKSDDIVETEKKQFVSAAEKEQFAKATHPEIIKVTVSGGASAWTGDEAPYTQQITVNDIKETDVPIVDISLGDIYETVQKQLDSYAYIYKILTYDGYIVVYASQPTEDDVTLQMKVDR